MPPKKQKRLSTAQQRALLIALPSSRKMAIKKHCQASQMRGEGMSDILKSVTKVLGPIAADVGPKVLKEFILPYVIQKIEKRLDRYFNPPGHSGNGLKLPGSGLKLPGQGRKRRVVKK